MAFTIVKNLTDINFTDKNNEGRIKWIVIHYFGSLGSPKAVSEYFRNAYRGASAHLALDADPEVYQSVEFEDIAWHCGTSGTYYHASCRNSNSIGIEVRPYKLSTSTMYASDKDWYFTEETIDRLVEVVQWLMAKYNIDADHVIRHYDVTHKQCPRPYQGSDTNKYYGKTGDEMWAEFKARISSTTTTVTTKTYADLVASVSEKIGLSSPTHWKKVLAGQITVVPAYLQAVFEKVCIKAGLTYTTKTLEAVADTILDLSADEDWQKAITGSYVPTADYMVALFKRIDEKIADDEYLVRVTAAALNIRKGAGTNYAITGTIKDKGIYTIVATQDGWGKLKSGVGWISLKYTETV